MHTDYRPYVHTIWLKAFAKTCCVKTVRCSKQAEQASVICKQATNEYSSEKQGKIKSIQQRKTRENKNHKEEDTEASTDSVTNIFLKHKMNNTTISEAV